ncbi:hypothetical protein [Yoonia sp. SS1-5]|uniref:Lipoprotein n=1 Tax=Yoonia rhodophyticola TaxID=3137370 RepID=A0AAN0NLD4_9RHOB
MKKFVTFCAIGGLMAACATTDAVQQPVNVTPKNAETAVGLDVFAAQRAAGNSAPRYRGDITIDVVSLRETLGAESGVPTTADCTLDSGLYTASFATPAKVVVPNYGRVSPAIFVQCKSGSQSGNVTQRPRNVTAGETADTAPTRPDQSGDVFNYGTIVVTLK